MIRSVKHALVYELESMVENTRNEEMFCLMMITRRKEIVIAT